MLENFWWSNPYLWWSNPTVSFDRQTRTFNGQIPLYPHQQILSAAGGSRALQRCSRCKVLLVVSHVNCGWMANFHGDFMGKGSSNKFSVDVWGSHANLMLIQLIHAAFVGFHGEFPWESKCIWSSKGNFMGIINSRYDGIYTHSTTYGRALFSYRYLSMVYDGSHAKTTRLLGERFCQWRISRGTCDPQSASWYCVQYNPSCDGETNAGFGCCLALCKRLRSRLDSHADKTYILWTRGDAHSPSSKQIASRLRWWTLPIFPSLHPWRTSSLGANYIGKCHVMSRPWKLYIWWFP